MNPLVRDMLAEFDPSLELELARTPPASWYIDPRFAEHERDAVFARSWQMVARRDQFEADGDFVTADIAGEPIVVVRDKAQLRGFFNVCRHHAAQVVEGVSGCVRALHCPYHGWTYNLDGSLRSAPQFEQARDFDRTRHGLVPVRVDSWGEWVFVCLDEDTEPLDVFLQEVSEEFLALNTQALGFHECVSYTLDCNWKVFVDNFLDGGYHVPYLHRELNSTLDARDYRIETGVHHCLQTCPTSDADSPAGSVRGGGLASYFWIYPNLMINVYEGVMDVNLVLPLSAERCVVYFDYFFADQSAAFREQSMDVADRVQREDVMICESVQRGLRSRSYHVGRLSPEKEAGERLFHQLLHADLTSRI